MGVYKLIPGRDLNRPVWKHLLSNSFLGVNFEGNWSIGNQDLTKFNLYSKKVAIFSTPVGVTAWCYRDADIRGFKLDNTFTVEALTGQFIVHIT